MNTAALITAILASFVQYGPQLVVSITNLIHGNPQTTTETDAEYIARIQGLIDKTAADTTATDNQVIGS